MESIHSDMANAHFRVGDLEVQLFDHAQLMQVERKKQEEILFAKDQ